MSLALDLLRHGDTAAVGFRGRSDDALSELGWQQMRAATAHFGPWGYVLSSPLRRCAEFAREIARERGIPCTTDARLVELDFGAWEGKTNDQLMSSDDAALQAFWRDPWAYAPTGGEPLPQMAARVFEALAELAQGSAQGRGLVVTHGGVIRLFLARARGLPFARLAEISVGHAQVFSLRVTASRGEFQMSEAAGQG